MSEKVVVIISTAEAGKARTAAMYAVNALKHGWLEEVRLFFFGPAEQLLLTDEPLQQLLREYQAMDETAVACRFIADSEGNSEKIAALGVRVEYAGKMISDLLRTGYVPMVW